MHTARLLNVEERPFARVTKRLLGKDSLLRSPAQLPTPPPDDSGADQDAERQKQEQERRQWREDVMVDFALLESTFIRIQFLKDSNEKERQRYADEKTKILDTAQAVRDNTAELRIQLEEAQKTLTLRKEYDVLAEKITGNRMLKPREEQRASLEKLNAEISDLEHEGQEYEQTWIERKEQFDNIMAAGKQMLRVIRGEKDEPEKSWKMARSAKMARPPKRTAVWVLLDLKWAAKTMIHQIPSAAGEHRRLLEQTHPPQEPPHKHLISEIQFPLQERSHWIRT